MPRGSGLEYGTREATDDQEAPKINPGSVWAQRQSGESTEHRMADQTDHQDDERRAKRGEAIEFGKAAMAGNLTDSEKTGFVFDRDEGKFKEASETIEALREKLNPSPMERNNFRNAVDEFREAALGDVKYNNGRKQATEAVESGVQETLDSAAAKWGPEINIDWRKEEMQARQDATAEFNTGAANGTLTDQEKANFLANRDEKSLRWTATAIENFKKIDDPTEKEITKFKDVVLLLYQRAVEDVEHTESDHLVRNKARMAVREGMVHIYKSTDVNWEPEKDQNDSQGQANYAAAPLNAYQEAFQKRREEILEANAAQGQANYAANHKDEHQARAEALIEKATNHVTNNDDKMGVENIFGKDNMEWLARDPKESITLEHSQRFCEELVNHLVDKNVRDQDSVLEIYHSTRALTDILNGSPHFQEQNEIREYDQKVRWDEDSKDSRETIRAMAYGDSDKKLSDHIHEVSEYFEKKSHFTDSGSKSNVWDMTRNGAAAFAGHRAEEMLENAEQTAFALEANIVKIAELRGEKGLNQPEWQTRHLDVRNLEKKNLDYIEQINQDLRNADFNSKYALTQGAANGTDTTVWDQEKWDQAAKRKEEEDRRARSLMGKIGNFFRPKTEQEEATD